jgi:hypothetical protein
MRRGDRATTTTQRFEEFPTKFARGISHKICESPLRRREPTILAPGGASVDALGAHRCAFVVASYAEQKQTNIETNNVALVRMLKT